MGNEDRDTFDEFHRGYTGGERNAVRKILAAIKGAPIDGKGTLIALIGRVCREELDIDDLKEIEP